MTYSLCEDSWRSMLDSACGNLTGMQRWTSRNFFRLHLEKHISADRYPASSKDVEIKGKASIEKRQENKEQMEIENKKARKWYMYMRKEKKEKKYEIGETGIKWNVDRDSMKSNFTPTTVILRWTILNCIASSNCKQEVSWNSSTTTAWYLQIQVDRRWQ